MNAGQQYDMNSNYNHQNSGTPAADGGVIIEELYSKNPRNEIKSFVVKIRTSEPAKRPYTSNDAKKDKKSESCARRGKHCKLAELSHYDIQNNSVM